MSAGEQVGTELRRGALATLLGAALGVVLAVSARREARGVGSGGSGRAGGPADEVAQVGGGRRWRDRSAI